MNQTLVDSLLEPLKILICDVSSYVIGPAVAAFNVICPDSFEFIHTQFFRLCSLLSDVDEESQVEILKCLLRYGRTQFVEARNLTETELHSDHQLLLENTQNLLCSSNASVSFDELII